MQHQPVVSPSASKHLQQALRRLDQQLQQLEAELLANVEQLYAMEMQLLCSIPSIGRKTAVLMLLFAGGFTHLDKYCQLFAKAGQCPCVHTLGTSVRGKARITKLGGLICSKLFMCSCSARKTNAASKALYERLTAQGNSPASPR